MTSTATARPISLWDPDPAWQSVFHRSVLNVPLGIQATSPSGPDFDGDGNLTVSTSPTAVDRPNLEQQFHRRLPRFWAVPGLCPSPAT